MWIDAYLVNLQQARASQFGSGASGHRNVTPRELLMVLEAMSRGAGREPRGIVMTPFDIRLLVRPLTNYDV